MARFSADHVPAYRLYRRTGQAVVTIAGRDRYLGTHGTPASREAYNRLTAEWFTAGRNAVVMEARQVAVADSDSPTVDDVICRFWNHAQAYYRDAAGQRPVAGRRCTFPPAAWAVPRTWSSRRCTPRTTNGTACTRGWSTRRSTPRCKRSSPPGGGDTGRAFDVLLDGQVVTTQTLAGRRPGEFFDVDCPLPAGVLLAKQESAVIEFRPRRLGRRRPLRLPRPARRQRA